MSPNQDFKEKEQERKLRRRVFRLIFAILVLISGGFLIWKLSGLVVPVIVGALLAFLFRPIKERFKVTWLPHELQVLCSFAAIGLVLFFAFDTARKYIPDDKQQLEYKVRLKYKLNEKYQQLVMKSPKEKPSMLADFIQKQTGPLMDKINQLLDRVQTEQFLHDRSGHFGGDNKILGYFEANQNTRRYGAPEETPAVAPAATATIAASVQPPAGRAGPRWEPWILAPLIFFFLGFDNGQIRRYFISLVPNRYFELSLTLLDRLDSAIGKYLRGTLMECTLVGLTLCLGLILLGSPVGIATAIGLVCGLVNAIPMLGTLIALVICLGYALIAENLEPLIPGLDPNNLAL